MVVSVRMMDTSGTPKNDNLGAHKGKGLTKPWHWKWALQQRLAPPHCPFLIISIIKFTRFIIVNKDSKE